MAVISGAKVRPPAESSWLGRILARKPRMLAAIALANKMARMLWAMITKDEEFRGGPLSGSEGADSAASKLREKLKRV